jgi:hypothetical protein
MPTHEGKLRLLDGLGFTAPVIPETVERAVLMPDIGLTLRKLNSTKTKYDPMGSYFETIVELPNWKAEGITELYGFECTELLDPVIANQDDADKAVIGYQASNDNGATWLVWDNTQWSEAIGVLDGVFNDKKTIDERINIFPFSATADRQFQLRVKLTPGASGRQRPILKSFVIYSSITMDLYEDVSRSIKRYLDANFSIPMCFISEVTGATSVTIPDSSSNPSIQPSEPGFDVIVAEPSAVYNLTTDPQRLVNLFSGLSGRTITILGPQTGTLETQFTGIPDIFIGAEEFFQLSKIPSVAVTVDRLEQYNRIRYWEHEVERSIARGVGRNVRPRQYYWVYVTIRVQSSLKQQSRRMVDAIARILDKSDEFPSVDLGDNYCVYEQTNELQEDRIADGLFVGTVNLKILGKTWLKDPEPDVDLVQDIRILTGAQFTCNLNLPPHLRNVYREESAIDGSDC